MSLRISDYVTPAMNTMGSHLENSVREAVEHFMGPGFTLDNVRRRCRLVGYRADPERREVLFIDETPVLEIYPLETSYEETGTGDLVIHVTRRFRKLWVQKGAAT